VIAFAPSSNRSSATEAGGTTMEIGAVTNAAKVQSVNGARGQALLIEWDEPYRAVMVACLRLAGCGVVPTASVGDALAALERRNFDLLVWGVGDEDRVRRLELMGELRLRSQAPLIMVDGDSDTAQTDLEAGADQWLPRPFVPGALVGSIRASLRKAASSATRLVARLQVRGMVFDGGRRTVQFGGSEVFFTRQEWDLLSILISHPERYLAAQEILLLGWRAGEHAAEQLRTYVHRLRQKLEPLNLPCQLLSRHGQGYCLTFK
jgi:DNA-binding response OmpR family regulator